MIVQINQVNFRGKGNKKHARYFKEQLDQLLQQSNAVGIERVNVIVKSTSLAARESAPPGVILETLAATAIIAVDEAGNQLNTDTHLLALPCPPYCGKGGGDGKAVGITFHKLKKMLQ